MQKFSRALFNIVFFVLPFLCSLSTLKFVVAKPENLKIALALPIFIYLFWAGHGYRKLENHKKTILSIMAFLGFATLSSLWSHNFYWAISHLIPLWCSFLGAIVTYQYIRDLDSLFFKLSLAGAIVALIGLITTSFNLNIFNNLGEYGATFGNKNMASQFIILTIPLGLALFFKNKNKLTLTSSSISLCFLILAQARQAWLSLIVMGLVSIYFLIKHQRPLLSKKIFVPVMVFLTISGLIFTFLGNPKYSRLERIKARLELAVKQFSNPIGKASQGSNERVSHWINTLGMVKDNPLLGVGIGNWYIHYPLYHSKYIDDGRAYSMSMKLKNLHNDHLEILASVGLIGFGLWILMFFTIVRNCILFSELNFIQGLSCLMAVMAYLTYSTFSFPHKLFLPLMIIFTLALFVHSKETKWDIDVFSNRFRHSLIPLFFLSLWLINQYLYFSHNFYSGQVYSLQYDRESSNKDIMAKYIVYHSEKALKYNPYDENTAILFSKGLSHFKEYNRARKILKEVLPYYPYHESLLHNLGYISFQLKDYRSTLFYWKEVLKYQKDPSYQREIKINIDRIEKALQLGS